MNSLTPSASSAQSSCRQQDPCLGASSGTGQDDARASKRTSPTIMHNMQPVASLSFDGVIPGGSSVETSPPRPASSEIHHRQFSPVFAKNGQNNLHSDAAIASTPSPIISGVGNGVPPFSVVGTERVSPNAASRRSSFDRASLSNHDSPRFFSVQSDQIVSSREIVGRFDETSSTHVVNACDASSMYASLPTAENQITTTENQSTMKNQTAKNQKQQQATAAEDQLTMENQTAAENQLMLENQMAAENQAVLSTSPLVLDKQQLKKLNLPAPPKKPLSPYMRFSKGIWQQVKAANPGLSVCEVGATIGRIWRELGDANKQRFIEEFNHDKVRYDGELQGYLQMTGLQASDLIKPRAKKKDVKDKPPAPSRQSKSQHGRSSTSSSNFASLAASGATPVSASERPCVQPEENFRQMANSFCQADDGGVGQEGIGLGGAGLDAASTLPSFSQVWSSSDLAAATGQDLLTQMTFGGCLNEDANSAQMAALCNDHGQMVGLHQMAVSSGQLTLNSSSYSDDGGLGSNFASVDGQTSVDLSNQWLWEQVKKEQQLHCDGSTTQQQQQQQQQTIDNFNSYQQQISRGNAAFAENAVARDPKSGSKGSVSQYNVVNDAMPPGAGKMAISTTVGQQFVFDGNLAEGVGAERYVATSGGRPTGRVIVDGVEQGGVDVEKLILRSALVEKTQEVLRLMKELEQAYGLIHQLKQQNDFFHHYFLEQQQQQQAAECGGATSKMASVGVNATTRM